MADAAAAIFYFDGIVMIAGTIYGWGAAIAVTLLIVVAGVYVRTRIRRSQAAAPHAHSDNAPPEGRVVDRPEGRATSPADGESL
jgi:hypothetical protein